jgi:RNA polymerase sigma-70 factor (ECF subfamily)
MTDDRKERFADLYQFARPKILAYVLRRRSSPADVADIVAEVFTIAWRRFEDMPGGDANLLWLYVTARHVLENHGRSLRRYSAAVGRVAEQLARTATHVEPADEAAIVAQLCLASLPEDDREILMLAGWEGLNSSELGEVLRCTPTAARLRLHRARARLRVEVFDNTPASSSVALGHSSTEPAPCAATPREA